MSIAEQRVVLREYSFAYVAEGEGPSLFLVHGSVADYTTFSGIMPRLRSTFRCTAYSRRYHPPNAPPQTGDAYDMEEQAGDMIAIIQALSPRPVILFGSSFGAYIALVAALRAPESFRTLVLCEPPMIPLLLHHPQGRSLHDAFTGDVLDPARRAFERGEDTEGLRIFVEGVRGQPGWFNRLFPSMKADLMRFAPELRAEFLSSYRNYMVDLSPDLLCGVNVPTLLLGGQQSPPMFGRILDVLENAIDGSRRSVVPNAGHLLHLQNPGTVELILKTLVGHEAE
jgi:pimeloyl-ACP methyl ester carboxylesterase